jgi:predicted RNA-binding protein YlqC (UPF0109 family)
MKDFVSYVVRELAEHPADIAVTAVDGKQTTIFEVRCHPQDVGRLIGRSGKTIAALRTLLSSVAAKHGRRAVLEVAE